MVAVEGFLSRIPPKYLVLIDFEGGIFWLLRVCGIYLNTGLYYIPLVDQPGRRDYCGTRDGGLRNEGSQFRMGDPVLYQVHTGF